MIESHTKTSFESKLKQLGTSSGLNCVSPQKKMYQSPNPCSPSFLVPHNVVLFGDGVFTEASQVKMRP